MNSATLQQPHRNGVRAPENNRTMIPPISFIPPFPFINGKEIHENEEEAENLISFTKPSPAAVARFRNRFPDLFRGAIHRGAGSRYELNFLNVYDLLENWGILPPSTQWRLKYIIEADWSCINSACWGIKKRADERDGLPLAEHLILMAVMEVENMVQYGHRIVTSNLFDGEGFRDPNRSGLAIIDPREATRRINRWLRMQRPQSLMPEMNAMILLFPSPEEIQRGVKDTWRAREIFNAYFRFVEGILHQWVKQGSIRAFYASHEIGVHSIYGSRFRPHTHAVIWGMKPGLLFLRRAAAKGIVEYLPRIHTRWNSLRKFLPYTMRVSRVAPSYRAEFPEFGSKEDIVRFNTLAVQSFGKLIEVWKHTNARGKNRVCKSGIPTALDGVNFEEEDQDDEGEVAD